MALKPDAVESKGMEGEAGGAGPAEDGYSRSICRERGSGGTCGGKGEVRGDEVGVKGEGEWGIGLAVREMLGVEGEAGGAEGGEGGRVSVGGNGEGEGCEGLSGGMIGVRVVRGMTDSDGWGCWEDGEEKVEGAGGEEGMKEEEAEEITDRERWEGMKGGVVGEVEEKSNADKTEARDNEAEEEHAACELGLLGYSDWSAASASFRVRSAATLLPPGTATLARLWGRAARGAEGGGSETGAGSVRSGGSGMGGRVEGGAGRGNASGEVVGKASGMLRGKAMPGVDLYFLSHFHSDHYRGLSKHWQGGPIVCTPVTARLAHMCLGVDQSLLIPLTFTTTVNLHGHAVTLLPANHCPGSALILIRTNSPPPLPRSLSSAPPMPHQQQQACTYQQQHHEAHAAASASPPHASPPRPTLPTTHHPASLPTLQPHPPSSHTLLPTPSPAPPPPALLSATILHTGDFRACEAMRTYRHLPAAAVDRLYLDTTYCHPRYTPGAAGTPSPLFLPPCSQLFNPENPSILFRAAVHFYAHPPPPIPFFSPLFPHSSSARPFPLACNRQESIFCLPRHHRLLHALQWPALSSRLTRDATSSPLHVLPLGQLRAQRLHEYVSNQRGFTRDGPSPSAYPQVCTTFSPNTIAMLHYMACLTVSTAASRNYKTLSPFVSQSR
ncbi:unnamed protein product [Closterium sp. Yama58-4]|nr:unnamed protein product [Closterium sp. Yama58-4]